MDSKFSASHDPLPSPGGPQTQENPEAPGDILESANSRGDSPRAEKQKRIVNWSLAGSVHAIASQDYIGVLVAMILLVFIIGGIHPEFLAVGQLLDILNQASFVAILACGMAFLLAMRELDLSVGSIYGLTSLGAAMLMHAGVPSWIGAFIGLLIGAALGLINGLLIQIFRLPSIVATLATLSIFRGLIYALSNGNQVIGLSLTDPFANFAGGRFLDIPTNVWIMILIVVIFTIILRSTPFGYRVRAIGSNPEAARFSGLPMKQVRLLAFVLMGGLGGLAGMLSLGYFGSSDPNLGNGYELLAIAAAVIGGTPLRGGKATIVGAAFGAILLGIVSSGLAYFDVPINWTEFATGGVILLAVALDSLLRRTRAANKDQL
ncbi:MAG TPA: ABC transporter permease [Ktedonobacteraceae bacterium]|nr:ABC transporter permease [Ktedonobacteraceae bacterium]